MITFATLFTGIGGWDEGLRRAGLVPLWGCEIAPFPRSVCALRLPGIPIYDDVTTLRGSDVERPDILVASPPCQDLSVAGRRAGLAGVRSGLFFDFTRLAGELRPSWILMEQVPGLFSSADGRDFDIALAELEQLGYGLSWRTFDARFFGVPQRRRRVYVVGHLGGPCPSEVLFESEGSGWDLAPSDEEGEDAADEPGGGVANPLGAKRGFRLDLDNDTYVPEVAGSLTRRDYKGPRFDHDEPNVIAHTLRSSGFDASEDGTGRGTPLVAETLTSGANGRAGRRKEDDTNLVAYRKSARMNADPNVGDVRTTHAVVEVPTLLTMREGKDGGGKGPLVSEGESLTLATGNGQTLFETANVRRLTPRECERLMGFPDDWTAVDGPGVYAPRYSFRPLPNRHDRRRGNLMAAFFARKRAAMDGWRIVRGTPDGPRYAACGNAVVVNKAEWIGKRIAAVAAEEAV